MEKHNYAPFHAIKHIKDSFLKTLAILLTKFDIHESTIQTF